MIQVVLRCSRAGLNFLQESGSTIEVGDDEAGRMFAAGQCSFVNNEADKPRALAAAGLVEVQPGQFESTASPSSGSDATDDADDDSDSINGDGTEAPADVPGDAPKTGLAKAKAKKKAA